MRIGEAARVAGTTVRTIRYYEELGLLPGHAERAAGGHRLYDEADVERLADLVRLKELLGLTLDELRAHMAAEEARPLRRDELYADDTPVARRVVIVEEGLANVRRQQRLVARRRGQLDALAAELDERAARAVALLDELGADVVSAPGA